MRAVVLFVALFLAPSLLFAQNPGHGQYHEHYKEWVVPGTKDNSCCNDQDCRPVPYKRVGKEYFIWIREYGGFWMRVPPGSLLPHASFDESAHACYAFSDIGEFLGLESFREIIRPLFPRAGELNLTVPWLSVFCVALPGNS